MIKGTDCFNKYGHPDLHTGLQMWTVPAHLRKSPIPAKLYLNKDMIGPLTQALENLMERGFIAELKTWDGIFNIRPIRGYEMKYEALMAAGDEATAIRYLSIHSWAIALDVNAATNGLGKTPTLSPGFVLCFKDAGFDWGGDWARKDGMHFQLAKLA